MPTSVTVLPQTVRGTVTCGGYGARMTKTIWLCAAVTALSLGACKKDDTKANNNPPKTTDPGASGTTDKPAGPATLNGTGSSFQKAFQEVAIEGFKKVHKDITVNYGAGGSGKGRQDFSDMVTEYGC